jgi:hydrogenase nickel incorporation protein HypA/HybF
MHELSITESILKIALRHAGQSQAVKITDLYLVIGQLSSIVDDSVQFYWEIITKGTLAEGSRLHFTRIPTQLSCLDCGLRYAPQDEDLACPNCDSIRVKIVAGEEFQLESIEIETVEPVEELKSSEKN